MSQSFHPRSARPTDRARRRDRESCSTVRALILMAVAMLCAVAMSLAAYSASNPDHLPSQVGSSAEDGVNPEPVKLQLPKQRPLSAVALLGRQIFFDTAMSGSGQQSCASCHSPGHHYGPPNHLATQLGGEHMTTSGYRPPPSLSYLYRQPPFRIGPDTSNDDVPVSLSDAAAAARGVARAVKTAGTVPSASAMVPSGGLFWDGRADSLQRQAYMPMLNPVEMANSSLDEVAEKLERAPYADTFKQLFGPQIFRDGKLLVSEAMFAVGRYQIEDPSFHPFTSKYDYWLQGQARLTQTEMRGMRLFNNPEKANCAGCHLSQPTADGLPPLFTDTQYEALGVPRNPAIPANQDPKFFDLGICGPFRTNLADQTQYCGMFLTPTLRNSAERGVYFHNGAYQTLEQVMNFYNLRSTQPDKIYPRDASGKLQVYNDIPPKFRDNVDVTDAPFNRKPGETPAMSAQDIQDIIAFIKTLSDGYQPGS